MLRFQNQAPWQSSAFPAKYPHLRQNRKADVHALPCVLSHHCPYELLLHAENTVRYIPANAVFQLPKSASFCCGSLGRTQAISVNNRKYDISSCFHLYDKTKQPRNEGRAVFLRSRDNASPSYTRDGLKAGSPAHDAADNY